jgi:hypothetical protein
MKFELRLKHGTVPGNHTEEDLRLLRGRMSEDEAEAAGVRPAYSFGDGGWVPLRHALHEVRGRRYFWGAGYEPPHAADLPPREARLHIGAGQPPAPSQPQARVRQVQHNGGAEEPPEDAGSGQGRAGVVCMVLGGLVLLLALTYDTSRDGVHNLSAASHREMLLLLGLGLGIIGAVIFGTAKKR